MKIRSIAVMVATAIVTGVALAAPASAASVSMGDNFYSPATVTIGVGESVTWTDNGQQPHTVTSNDGLFDSSPNCPAQINTCMFEGDTYSRTFGNPGTYGYFCKVHGDAMSGTVVVQGAGSTTQPPTGGLPDTGPGDSAAVLFVLGLALLAGGAAIMLVLRRRA